MLIATSSFSKSSISKCFPSILKRKVYASNFSGLKSVIEKLRFRDGLVWMVGLTGQINTNTLFDLKHAEFPNSSSVMWTGALGHSRSSNYD